MNHNMAGFRGFLYALARLLGNVNAVKKGKGGLSDLAWAWHASAECHRQPGLASE